MCQTTRRIRAEQKAGIHTCARVVWTQGIRQLRWITGEDERKEGLTINGGSGVYGPPEEGGRDEFQITHTVHYSIMHCNIDSSPSLNSPRPVSAQPSYGTQTHLMVGSCCRLFSHTHQGEPHQRVQQPFAVLCTSSPQHSSMMRASGNPDAHSLVEDRRKRMRGLMCEMEQPLPDEPDPQSAAKALYRTAITALYRALC